MKITKDIWTLLTSVNTPLVNVFSIIFSAIELYMYSLIISALLKTKISFNKRVIFVLLLVLEGAIFSSKVPSPYYTFINLLFAMVIAKFAFNTSLFKSFLSTICFYLITFFCTIIWLIVYVLLFNCSSNGLEQILLYKIILSISVDICYYIIYKVCLKHPVQIQISAKNEKRILLFLNIFLCLATVALQFLIAYLYFDFIPLGLNLSFLSAVFQFCLQL